MCLAVYHAPASPATLTKRQWLNAADNNPDGIGLLWAVNGELRSRKWLPDGRRKPLMEAWGAYVNLRRLGVPMAVHFRYTTHGENTLDNTHPFFVRDDLAFVHNGVLDCSFPTDKAKSDTYVFNEMLKTLPPNFLDSANLWRLVEMAAEGSKLVFLRADGKAWIANMGLGHWDQGSWFSNNTHESSVFASLVDPWEGGWTKNKDGTTTWEPLKAKYVDRRASSIGFTTLDEFQKKAGGQGVDTATKVALDDRELSDEEWQKMFDGREPEEDDPLDEGPAHDMCGLYHNGRVYCLDCAPMSALNGVVLRAEDYFTPCDECGKILQATMGG